MSAKADGGPGGTAPGDDSQDPALVYDPLRAWDATPVAGDADGDGYPDYFEGYRWLQATDPDSAGTMSAIVTGRKVYRGGINIDGFGNQLVPAWVRGPNVRLFHMMVDGKDPVHGPYIDQVDLGKVMIMSVAGN